jgi:hypothetical protein
MTGKKQKRAEMRKRAKTLAGTVPSQINCAADEWAKTPEPVRIEIWRAILELESGIERYQPDASTFEKVRKYHDMALASGTTLARALEQYIQMEALWRQNPVAGFVAIAENFGMPPDVLLAQLFRDLQTEGYMH